MEDSSKHCGEFGLESEVISEEEIRKFCTVVNSAADLVNIADRPTVVVATKFNYGSSVFNPGDVLIKTGSIWEKLSDVKARDPRNRLAAPSRFRGYIIGNRVYLRWNDPDNTFITDSTDQRIDTASWTSTLLIRKFGSEPDSMLDGTPILELYNRNAYKDEYFVDVIPKHINVQVYYKLYVFSSTGVITESNVIAPNVFDWDVISEELNRPGDTCHIRDMFAPGDVVRIENDGSTVDLLVVGIDNVTTVSGNPHSITFAFKHIENSWEALAHDDQDLYANFNYYRRTADAETRRGKIYYYQKNGRWQDGWLCETTGEMPDVASIRDLYEYVSWNAASGIASWDKSFISVAINSDGSGSPIDLIRSIDPSLASRIIETKVKSVIDEAGTVVEDYQKFFLPSITEVVGLNNKSVAEGRVLEYFEEFASETEQGKVFDPAGFEWTDRTDAIHTWWTRSIDTSDKTSGYYIDPTNTNSSLLRTQNAMSKTACVVMFTIGQKHS